MGLSHPRPICSLACPPCWGLPPAPGPSCSALPVLLEENPVYGEMLPSDRKVAQIKVHLGSPHSPCTPPGPQWSSACVAPFSGVASPAHADGCSPRPLECGGLGSQRCQLSLCRDCGHVGDMLTYVPGGLALPWPWQRDRAAGGEVWSHVHLLPPCQAPPSATPGLRVRVGSPRMVQGLVVGGQRVRV